MPVQPGMALEVPQWCRVSRGAMWSVVNDMHVPWVIAAAVLGLGLVGILALAQTRWLQSDTLKKCLVLSVGVHVLLALVAAGLGGMRPVSRGSLDEGRMTIVMIVGDDPTAAVTDAPDGIAEASDAVTPAVEDLASAVSVAAQPSGEPGEFVSEPVDPLDEPTDVAVNEAVEHDAPLATSQEIVPLLAVASVTDDAKMTGDAMAEAAAAEDATVRAAEDLAAADPLKMPDAEGLAADTRGVASSSETASLAEALPSGLAGSVYADRFGSRRQAAAAARGGSLATEQAVQAGLKWLVAAQSPDGRWDADLHGAGIERTADGRDRRAAGSRSDHGVTGLALLALLGAGNTHRVGEHAAAVERGLRFLVEHQATNGSLAGDAEFFAALYCHGMATIALAEAVTLTADETLRAPLARAIGHTLAMQSPATGGWRYAAGDRGDTSQLGWQVMAISSGQLAGVAGLEPARARAGTFLQSVSSGRFGGLAAYREGERPSIAMTAEALFCRLLLGLEPGHPAAVEAVELIAASPPDVARPNAYTWYYATLASFHVGGPQWERWNTRMQAAVLALQRRDGGSLAGSWDPDPVWGGHGGRVYATAMSVLTLEVYYRYLPMHGLQGKRAVAVVAAP